MRSVCIVGSGPAGLVGAKTLLQTGQFHVTVYEKADRIGGIWALDQNSQDGYLSPHTPTNISKFTVAFSDLRWDGLDLSASSDETQTPPPWRAPMFPQAWQVNRYLEAYRAKYIPSETIRLETAVTQARRISSTGKDSKWQITTRDKAGHEETFLFDFLVVGSGFFSAPRPLDSSIATTSNLNIKCLHSARYKSLRDLFPDNAAIKGKIILVFGGGNSAGEAAGTLGQQLSDQLYSSATGRSDTFKSFKIVHVTPQPLYAIPPWNPTDQSSTTFLPLDLKLYDLSRRPKGPITGNGGRVPQVVKDMVHTSLGGLVGGDQSDLGSAALTIPREEPKRTAHVALSESYPEFVRSGLIEVVAGRVVSLTNAEDGTVRASVKDKDGQVTSIDDIAGVIHATGYTPLPALEFLDQDIKDKLHYDPTSLRLPIILEGWQTTSEAVPDLAVLGFYEGPYWGVIEMQARVTAQRWLTNGSIHRQPFEEPAKMLDLRHAMQQRANDVPQYWFGDPLGYNEQIAATLNLRRNDASFAEREGCSLPARYLSSNTDSTEAEGTMQDFADVWHACLKVGRGVPRVAFRALQGNWQFRRVIDSALASFPSGVVTGTASFHPRTPTADKSGKTFDLEYLYIESGTLTLSNGAAMTAKRRYVYRYDESNDELSVWFIKPDNDLEVDYLFHNLTFAPPHEAREAGGVSIARADHLCVADMYWTEYRLPIKGISLHEFSMMHTVKGPKKDYVATTEFVRPRK